MKFGNLLHMLSTQPAAGAHNQHFQVLYAQYKRAKKHLKHCSSGSGPTAQQQQGDFAADLVRSIQELAAMKALLQQQCQQRMQELQQQEREQQQLLVQARSAPMLLPPAAGKSAVVQQQAQQLVLPTPGTEQHLRGPVQAQLQQQTVGLEQQQGAAGAAEGAAGSAAPVGGGGDEEEVDGLHQTYRDAVHFHGEVLLVMNWCMLAYTMCLKILKKHNKRTGTLLQAPELRDMLSQPAWSTEEMARLVCAAEELVTRIQQALQDQQQQEEQQQQQEQLQPLAQLPEQSQQLQQPQQLLQQGPVLGAAGGGDAAGDAAAAAAAAPAAVANPHLVRGLLAPIVQLAYQPAADDGWPPADDYDAARVRGGLQQGPLQQLSSHMSWSSQRLLSQMHTSSWDSWEEDEDEDHNGSDHNGSDNMDDGDDADQDEAGDDNLQNLVLHRGNDDGVVAGIGGQPAAQPPRQQGLLLPAASDAVSDSTSVHDHDTVAARLAAGGAGAAAGAADAGRPQLVLPTAAVPIPIAAGVPGSGGVQRQRSNMHGHGMTAADQPPRAEQGRMHSGPLPGTDVLGSGAHKLLPDHASGAQIYSWDCLEYVSVCGSCSPPLGTSPMSDEGTVPLQRSPRSRRRSARCAQCGMVHSTGLAQGMQLPSAQRPHAALPGTGPCGMMPHGMGLHGVGLQGRGMVPQVVAGRAQADDEATSHAMPQRAVADAHAEGHLGAGPSAGGPQGPCTAGMKPCTAGMKRGLPQGEFGAPAGGAMAGAAAPAVRQMAPAGPLPHCLALAAAARERLGIAHAAHAQPGCVSAESAAGAGLAGPAAGVAGAAARLSHTGPNQGPHAEMVLQMQMALQAWEFLAHGSSTPSTVMAAAPAATAGAAATAATAGAAAPAAAAAAAGASGVAAAAAPAMTAGGVGVAAPVAVAAGRGGAHSSPKHSARQVQV